MSIAQRVSILVLALVAATACGSSDGSPSGPGGPPQNPAITISVSASSLSVQAGANGTVTASIVRSGGFTGTVAIVTTGAPAGVSAVASNVATSGTTTTGTITVSVAASVAAGSYPLTITGSGSGVTSVQTTLTLTVTAAPPAADYSLSVTSPLALAQGATGTAPVTINRTNFTGAVTLTATGLPTGVTASYAPSAPTGASSTLTLQVGASVAPGSYSLQVVGSGTPGTRMAALTLTVSVAGSYALTANPSAVTVAPSGSVSTTLTVAPTGGFTGAVALRVAGLPSGMTASLSPVSTSSTSTLTLTSTGATPGMSTPTIIGSTAGLSDVSTTLGVTVMPVSTNTTITLDYSACIANDRVLWAAYRDGPTGSWVPVTVSANRLTFTLTGELGGMALATDVGVGVFLERASWLAEYSERPCIVDEVTRTVSGTTTNLPNNSEAIISFGQSVYEVRSNQPAFAITDASVGVHDLFGYARTGSTVGVNDRGVVRRDVDPSPPGTVSPLDFAGSESFAPELVSVSVVGAVGQELEHSMSYATRTGGLTCDLASFYEQLPVTGSTLTASGVPASRQRANDLHVLDIRSSTTNGQSTVFQSTVESFHTLTARTVTLPAPFNPTASRVSGSAHHQLRVQGTMPAEHTSLFALSTGLSTDRDYAMVVSSGWLTSAIGTPIVVDVVMPDFSGIAGFNSSWAPRSNESVEYTIVGVNSIGALSLSVAEECRANARVAGSGKEGVLPD